MWLRGLHLRSTGTRFCRLLATVLGAGLLVSAETPSLLLASSFPADANVLNVRDFGAKGDGVADDTEAIQHAIAASGQSTGYSWWHDRIVYIPRGRYRISAPLTKRYQNGNFGSGMLLIGDGVDATTLILADHAKGYADPAKPRAMIFTTSQLLDRGGPYGGGKNYPVLGEGNDAYENFIESLTVDVGQGNPGAIAVDYLANNLGAIRHVHVQGHEGSGAVGINMTRKWIGPAILEDVTVDGFAVGIDVANTEYGVTLDHVRLRHQVKWALHNSRNVLSAKDLFIETSTNCIGIANDSPAGLITLVQAELHAEGTHSALQNRGTIVFRDSTVHSAEPSLQKQFTNQPINGVLTAAKWATRSPWKLPMVDPPQVADGPIEHWANVARYGAVPDPSYDSTVAFRKAFASGATTVYIPNGIYGISDSLVIPSTLTHLAGMNSALRLISGKREAAFLPEHGMLRVLDPSMQPLLIDRLGFSNSEEQIAIEVAGNRDVVLRDIPSVGVGMLARPSGGGRVFLDDVCCGGMRIAGDRPVVARQFDTEGAGTRIINANSPLWIMGLKTERPNVILQQGTGATTELMGGLIYMVLPNPDPSVAAFSAIDSTINATFAEEAFADDRAFAFYLVSSDRGKRRTVARRAFPMRVDAGSGRIIPLLSTDINDTSAKESK